MKHVLIILFFFLSSLIKWPIFKDKKFVQVTYSLNYKPSKARNYRSTALTNLYITENSSVYIDDKLNQHLLLSNMPNRQEKAEKILAIGSPAFRYIIRKDYSTEKYLFMDDYLKNEYLAYEEPLTQDWNITTDTATHSGLLSYKATCQYGGRDWTAWYAPEVSIPEGPYKFYGLPGLIVKLNSDDGDYLFLLRSLNYTDKLPELPIYETVTQNRFRQMMDSITSFDKLESLGNTIGKITRNGKEVTKEEEILREKEGRKDKNTIEIE